MLAKRLYLNEKGWNKYTKHFIILLSTKVKLNSRKSWEKQLQLLRVEATRSLC